jgi:hypothetical protein
MLSTLRYYLKTNIRFFLAKTYFKTNIQPGFSVKKTKSTGRSAGALVCMILFRSFLCTYIQIKTPQPFQDEVFYCFTYLLPVQCFCTTNDLQDLIGNCGLAGFVVCQFQFFDESSCIISCLVHSSHSGSVFCSK